MRDLKNLAVSALAALLVVTGLGTPASAARPDVTAVTPAPGATNVPLDVRPTVTFREPVPAGALRYSFVATATGADVAGHYAYDAAAHTATFTPRGTLAAHTRYTITIKVRDASGALSSPYRWIFSTGAAPPDTTAPTPPGPPVADDVTPMSARLSWPPATDAGGVTEYRVTGGPSPTTSATPDVTLTGLTPGTRYTVTVSAVDAAGNVSAASESVIFATPLVQPRNARTGEGIPGATGNTLVLYDSTGPYAFLGEQYAMVTANLASHFGAWTAQAVADYSAGELAGFDAVIYVGSTYDEPLPVAFLDDVAATTKPVIWMYDNIWQLTARSPDFAARRGFTWTAFDFAEVGTVNYKGKAFSRYAANGGGIMGTTVTDPARVTVVAEAVRADGSTFPWGVRSGNFTYLGEIPYSYMSANDRYVAFADLLFDVLAPATPRRHRAAVRIEDVGPDAEPAELRAITNYLYGEGIPFSVAVYSRYRDPRGVHTGGVPEDYTLADRPQVVAELKYMESHGGTLLMHGYTHQYGNIDNPYNGVSADDFEFYRAHVDANDFVIYDGPVAEDSVEWARSRIDAAFAEFARAGLKRPTIFEFPHYAASDADNRAMADTFDVRYDRAVYASGALRGGQLDYSRIIGQFFPYAVRDIYGVLVVPENLGNVELEPFNNHPAHLPADIVKSAELNTVVRDGVASFFFHPYVPTSYLRETVAGIRAAGYEFVPGSSL